MADERDTGPTIPRSTDEENEAIDTTSAEPLRKAKIEEPDKRDSRVEPTRSDRDPDAANPPRTSSGNLSAPKFGSAGSGGAEFEPGPERD